MSILDSIQVTGALAPRITIYGSPGIGKSTLASQFPDPLFLMTEQTGLVGINAIQPVNNFGDFWRNIKQLLKEPELPFKTIVIDSISKLDQLVIKHILDAEPVRKDGTKASTLATACGGYGAGYLAASARHKALKNLLDEFQAKGVTVVYIGHLSTVKHKAPDMEDFDKYSIVMGHEKCKEAYIDDVDLVGFCRLKSYVSDTDSGRALVHSTSDRVILTGVSDGHVSKNRFKMPNEIPMSYESLAKYIPFFNQGE